jgi:hypothetical protein
MGDPRRVTVALNSLGTLARPGGLGDQALACGDLGAAASLLSEALDDAGDEPVTTR